MSNTLRSLHLICGMQAQQASMSSDGAYSIDRRLSDWGDVSPHTRCRESTIPRKGKHDPAADKLDKSECPYSCGLMQGVHVEAHSWREKLVSTQILGCGGKAQ